MKRRDFTISMTGGLLGSGVCAAYAARGELSNVHSNNGRPSYLIYDAKFKLAAVNLASGFATAPLMRQFDGEFSFQWYESIVDICRQQRADILGVTRHSEFFIIDTLSTTFGYSIVDRQPFPDHAVWMISARKNSVDFA